MVVGDVEIRMMADMARLSRDMEQARSVVGSAMTRITTLANVAKAALIGFTAAAGIGAIMAFAGGLKGMISSNIEATGSLYDLSLQTGASVAALTAFREIGATSDTTAEAMAGAMNKLSKGMAVANEESKGLPQAIAAIGLNFSDLRKMNPDDQMLAIAKALDGFGSGAGKSAVAMALFGKQGAQMLPFLADLAGEADKVSASLSDQEKAAKLAASAMSDNYGDTITQIQRASRETGKAISAGMLPALYEASQAVLAVMTDAGGLRDSVKSLAADGSIARWTRSAVDGITYLIDGFDRVAQAVSVVSTIVGGALSTMATFVTGSASAMKSFIEGDYTKSFGIMKETAVASVGVVQGAFKNLGTEISRDTLGEKLRAQLKLAREAKVEAGDNKPQVDYKPPPEVDKAMQGQIKAFHDLTAAMRTHVEETARAAAGLDPYNEAQKENIKLTEELAAGKRKLTPAQEAEIRAYIKQWETNLQVIDTLQKSKKAAEDMAKSWKDYNDGQAKAVENAAKEAEQNERLVETFGMTKSAIEAMELARLEDQYAQRGTVGMTLDEIDVLEKLIEAKKRSAAALGSVEAKEASKKASDDMIADGKKIGDSIQQSLTDALMRGFESGKGFGQNLIDTLKNMFGTLVLRPIISAILAPVAGGLTSVAQAATGTDAAAGAGGLVGMAQTASALYKAISGGFSALSGTVADAVQVGLYETGMSSELLVNGAIAKGAGAFAGVAAGVLGGVMGGRLISGQYGSNSTVNAGTAIGAAVGSVVPVIGTAIGALVGGLLGGVGNRLFGMGDKNVTASGMSGTLSDAGLAGSNYSKWTQKGGWFRSDKSGTDKTAFDAEVTAQFVQGFATIKAASAGFATSLGASTASLAGYSKTFDIALTKDAAANEKAITDFFTGVGDEIALRLVPGLAQFNKSGETMAATLQRLAGDFDATNQVAMLMGSNATKMFGSLGIESASARERLIDLAGGVSNLSSQASAFAQNYLTEAERLAPVSEAVGAAMASLGLASVTTREQFKKVVQGLDVTTAAGAQQFASMMALSDAFAQVHPAIEATTAALRTEADVLNERKDLQKQIDQLTLTSTQLRQKERQAIDASNLALFDQITQLQNAVAMSDTLKSSIDNLDAFRKSIGAFSNSQLLGSLSPLTAMQKDAESKRQYEDMLAKAKGGDEAARSGITAAATAFLAADQIVNASSSAYVANFAKVQSDLAALEKIAGSQMTDAQAQLSRLDQQLSQLAALNGTASSIETALSTSDWSAVGSTDMAPLANEVKALRADNEELRADNAALLAAVNRQTEAVERQTNAVVAATLTAAANNADAVTAGAAKTSAAQSWKQQLINEAAQ